MISYIELSTEDESVDGNVPSDNVAVAMQKLTNAPEGFAVCDLDTGDVIVQTILNTTEERLEEYIRKHIPSIEFSRLLIVRTSGENFVHNQSQSA